jgi:hypothetical protein
VLQEISSAGLRLHLARASIAWPKLFLNCGLERVAGRVRVSPETQKETRSPSWKVPDRREAGFFVA